jgi:TolB protein
LGDHPGDDRYPSWSPDGRHIAFWSDREGGGYYVIPAPAGPVQRVAPALAGTYAFHYSPPHWSADGTQLAYVMYERAGEHFDAFVEITSMATRDTRRVRLPGSQESRLDLSWSLDGRYLAYVDAAQQLAETTQLRVLRLSDGRSVAVTDDRANVRGPIWSRDGRYLYFSANRIGSADLWRQRVTDGGTPTGHPQQVTTAVEVRHAAFSADDTRIVFSKGRWVANIWRVPILDDRTATWADAEQMTSDHAYIEFVDVSRDGRRLLFSSDRAGNQDLWTLVIGGETTRLTYDAAPEWGPRWSPDEREIVFYSYRSGDREIWAMPAAGGAARQLTRARGLDATPMWSPDGRTIVFRSERTGNSEIWTVSADGREERQLTQEPAADYSPAWSPDGQWLAFNSSRQGTRGLWRMPAAGGTPERLTRRSVAGSLIWSPDGARIYFGEQEGSARLWALSLKDGSERVVADLAARRGGLAFQPPATDGKYLYFSWRNDVGDIWAMDVVQ